MFWELQRRDTAHHPRCPRKANACRLFVDNVNLLHKNIEIPPLPISASPGTSFRSSPRQEGRYVRNMSLIALAEQARFGLCSTGDLVSASIVKV